MNDGGRANRAFVLWFTGLSGAGKSTLADGIYDSLRSSGAPIERLDGDSIRALFPGTGFSREERNNHIKRVGYMASLLERNGVIVIASFVSPYAEARDFVRGLCADYFEVYLSTPLNVCEKRDAKGLYEKARRGEIKNFTGISDPYEVPARPDLTIDTESTSVEAALDQVRVFLRSKGFSA